MSCSEIKTASIYGKRIGTDSPESLIEVNTKGFELVIGIKTPGGDPGRYVKKILEKNTEYTVRYVKLEELREEETGTYESGDMPVSFLTSEDKRLTLHQIDCGTDEDKALVYSLDESTFKLIMDIRNKSSNSLSISPSSFANCSDIKPASILAIRRGEDIDVLRDISTLDVHIKIGIKTPGGDPAWYCLRKQIGCFLIEYVLLSDNFCDRCDECNNLPLDTILCDGTPIIIRARDCGDDTVVVYIDQVG